MSTAVIVQARLDSHRLPGKALLPLGGEPALLRVLEALSWVTADAYLLACPTECVEAFTPLARRVGKFAVFGGDKYDVLKRYCDAIAYLGLDTETGARVIRATGDNPFVFADAATRINAEGATLGADYAAYAGLPLGAGVESVAVTALLRAGREATLPAEREHVCPYLYAGGHDFLLHRPLAPLLWRGPALRLTCDTQADYNYAAHLFATLAAQSQGQERATGEAILRAVNTLEE
jgi:spore coat polysaccharide biosynthesis protein SpsF